MDSKVAKQLAADWLRVQQHLSSLEQQYSASLDTSPSLSPSLAKAIASFCNGEALSFLAKRDFATAYSLLRRAEALSGCGDEIRGETLRNLACYYGRVGKPFRALTCLDKVFEIEAGSPMAKTHVNYCAILSQLGKHTQALAYGLKAVMILQDEILWKVLRGTTESESKNEELSVAYYNLAVEYEYLHEVTLYSVRRSQQMVPKSDLLQYPAPPPVQPVPLPAPSAPGYTFRRGGEGAGKEGRTQEGEGEGGLGEEPTWVLERLGKEN